VIVVPTSAILNLEKDNVVMTVRDNRATRIFVKKGPSNTTETVILSGLLPNDRLIVKGHALVSDGSAIRIMN
jgi:hypothetical protein